MKKYLIAGLLALSVTVPAQAGNNPWPVIGGIAGGLLLGEVIHNHHNHNTRPVYDEDVYYENQTTCWYEYHYVWDPYQQHYVKRRIRYCD